MKLLKLMTDEVTREIAKLVLSGVHRAYPNQPAHVLIAPEDARLPHELHPAFFGCYDWHSAVHSHWTMLKLLEHDVAAPDEAGMQTAMAMHLSAEAMAVEFAYFQEPGRASYERPYGWAWIWKLSSDLARSPVPGASEWHANIRPLAELLAERFATWLDRQSYPCRAGTHGNTAFAMAFAIEYAKSCGKVEFARSLAQSAIRLYGQDRGFTFRMEPSGNDFVSPMLAEIALMGQLLPPSEWRTWLAALLPDQAELTTLSPVVVTDRGDPQGVHLDGLNLSRAYHLAVLADLFGDEPSGRQLAQSAIAHWRAGMEQLFSGDFMGEHWLGSFSVLAAIQIASNSMDCLSESGG